MKTSDVINSCYQLHQADICSATQKRIVTGQSSYNYISGMESNITHSIQNQQQKQNQQPLPQSSSSKLDIPIESILCHICQQPIAIAVQVVCGHSFCQYCLSEYFLVALDCPICGAKMREKKCSENKRLDGIIQQFCNHLGTDATEKLKLRKQARKAQLRQKRVQNIQSGALIDVRDDDYIWQKGRIIRTFNRLNSDQNRMRFFVVQYIDSQRRQQFSATSHRVAKAGYYTDREDIPHSDPNRISLLEKQSRTCRISLNKIKVNKESQEEGQNKEIQGEGQNKESQEEGQNKQKISITEQVPDKKQVTEKNQQAQEDKQDEAGRDNIGQKEPSIGNK